MKKVGLSIIGFFIIVGGYYFTLGATQLNSAIKESLHQELKKLQTYGVTIEEKQEEQTKEHFVMHLEKIDKLLPYLNQKGVEVSLEEVAILEGLKIGVDIAYSRSLSTSLIVDIYPVKLPNKFFLKKLAPKEKKVIAQLQEMLHKKVFLTHFKLNKIGSKFDGYIKDINQTLLFDTKTLHLDTQKTEFAGEIKNSSIQNFKEHINLLHFTIKNEADFMLNDLTLNYRIYTANNENYTMEYKLKNLTIKGLMLPSITINSMKLHEVGKIENRLLSKSIDSSIHTITLKDNNSTTQFNTILCQLKSQNIDIETLNQLLNTSNISQSKALIQTLISKNIQLSMPTFLIKEVIFNHQNLQGFNLQSKIAINKNFTIDTNQTQESNLINALDAELNLNISNTLFATVAQHPKVIFALMFFPPKNQKESKTYQIKLQNGMITINGKVALGK